MNRDEALSYLKQNHRGVLTTQKKDGRPQLSNVVYVLDFDGNIKISTTNDRYKAKNIRRDPRVSLLALGDDWYRYIVAEGSATVSDEGQLADLRRIYEAIAGKPHPDWEEYDRSMIADHRVIISLTVEKLYPLD